MPLCPMPPCPEPGCAPKVPSYLDSAPYILLLDFFMVLLKLILLEYLVFLILNLTNMFSFCRAHFTFKQILMTCHPKGIKGPFVRFGDSASPSTLPWISWIYWFFYLSSVPWDDDLLEDTNSVLGNSVSPKAHTVKGDWRQSSFLRPATQLWSCLVCVTWFFAYNTF